MTNGRSTLVLESKLTPPLPRHGMVPRVTLLDRLEGSTVAPVVAICAPPGYGKTTLLADWAALDPRPFAWLSIDGRDNDPAVLLTYIAVALDRHEVVDHTVFRALSSPGASIMGDVVPRLGAALSARTHPVVVVLDDLHLLHNQECVDAVAVLVDHLPARSQVVFASRAELPLPVGRLRAEGRITEIGPHDLAMGDQEAGSLLRAADVELAEAELAGLTRRTEGWPVALYLAALAIKARGKGVRVTVEGRDRFLVDYLQSVLLSRLSPADVASSRARRCWTACPGRCATRSSAPPGQPLPWSRWSGRPPGHPPRSPPGVVPLPSPVPGAAACGTGAPRAGAGPRAHPPGGDLV